MSGKGGGRGWVEKEEGSGGRDPVWALKSDRLTMSPGLLRLP